MHRALGGAPIFPVHRSACVGAGLTWRSLGRSLLANFNACAARLAPPKSAGQHTLRHLIKEYVRYAAINTKK